jgi:hypothetical protein
VDAQVITARTQELLYDPAAVYSTQYLVLDCEDGRPSSIADVQVWTAGTGDDSTEESATTGLASVESAPNTTIATAAVGPLQTDPRAMVVASGTSFTVGRRYQITEDNGGHWEVFEAAKVNGTTITARHPLKNDYSVGSTVQSTRATIAVSSTWIAELANISPHWTPNPGYRAKWILTVNGSATEYTAYFDVVRYVAQHRVTPPDVDFVHPGWLDGLGPDDQIDQGRRSIEAAFEAVKHELYRDGKADQAFRNAEMLSRLTIHRCQYDRLLNNAMRGGGNADALALGKSAWDAYYQGVIRSPVAPIDEGGGGASAPNRPAPMWRR